MDFSVDMLISEVQKKCHLWNVHHKHYHDRLRTDQGWESVGRKLNIPKEVAKSKWKNTRDHFNKEFKKIPASKSRTVEAAAAAYKGKWPYFREMLFLKDMDKLDENQDDVSDEPSDFYEGSNGTTLPEPDGNPVPLFHADTSVPELNFDSAFAVLDSGPPPPRRKRKNGDEEEAFEKYLTIEQEKLDILRSVELDDDVHFLKSLLPFFKQMGPLSKLSVRSKIQQVVADELIRSQHFEPHPTTLVTAVYDQPPNSAS